MARQLTAASVASTRSAIAARQKYKCPICRNSLAIGVVALDHDHKTGMCRGTLCQSCNVGEGKVKAGMLFRTPTSNLAYQDPIQWLRNLANYLEFHKDNPSGLLHPTFDSKTGKQKPVKRKK